MKQILLSVAFSLFCCSALLAQDAGKKKPVKGTYQIEVHNIRAYPYIPDNLEELVMNNRKATEVNYVILSEYVKIKVLPESEINSPGFVPVAKEVTHIFN